MNHNKKGAGLSRRQMLKVGIVSTAAVTAIPSMAINRNPGGNPGNPTCGTLTVDQTEGPYFSPGSPERNNIREAGYPGTPLIVKGRVLSGCDPVPFALLDFWQADNNGEYDNQGFRFRGHQYTNANGDYLLETIVPGLYPGRTRHIHVKVQRPNGRILTTQLYFPADASGNRRDFIYDSSLLLTMSESDGVQTGEFNFVIA